MARGIRVVKRAVNPGRPARGWSSPADRAGSCGSPEAIRAIPGVSVVLGNDDKKDLIRFLELDPEEQVVAVSDIQSVENAVPHEINSFSERSRAFVQIQNGCNAYCSYCIIPYARGSSRSAAPLQVVEQVNRLVDSGYPEIVLTGIHIGAYGVDLSPPTSLVGLLETIQGETDVRRLRLGSIEPNEIDDDLIAAIAGSDTICPHLHIPLQSGDDRILREMNRHYSADDFYRLIEKVCRDIPDVAIGLDVITGFPGEDDSHFDNTCRLIESLPVSYLHVFPFSRRPGTPAAGMPKQVPGDVAKNRSAILRNLGREKQAAYAGQFIGCDVEIVVEGQRSNGRSVKGLSRHYLPVIVEGEDMVSGSVQRVVPGRWKDDALQAVLA